MSICPTSKYNSLGWTKSAMGSLQTSILHSDGKWVQGRSQPEISYEFLLRGIKYQRKSLITSSSPTIIQHRDIYSFTVLV
eukprot:scaffold122435_cov56-Cyclotella_meneghiniana.AAC.1